MSDSINDVNPEINKQSIRQEMAYLQQKNQVLERSNHLKLLALSISFGFSSISLVFSILAVAGVDRKVLSGIGLGLSGISFFSAGYPLLRHCLGADNQVPRNLTPTQMV